ncbi:cytochrome P450/oxidoreductase [Leifsonia sp. RAF41]|uniref:cytochrome P450/oxidoreductase n=1 Tax=Leifsonia sp. RAF41 TaxID=3233056 RepID=UPI003F9E97E8
MTTFTTPPACPFADPERLFADLEAARQLDDPPQSETFGGARVFTAYDDIVAALHDPETFSSQPTVGTVPSPWREQFEGRVPSRGTLIGVDNPDHDRLRSSVNTFFMPRRLARFEPWIREEAHRLVDRFAESGEADLKTAFALPLPLRVISHIVGIDAERGEWVGEALGFFMGPRDIHHPGTPDEKAAKLLDLHDHLRELMQLRRVDRRDDLISHIWDQRDSGAVEMTDFEMLSMFPGLMLAGHETSSNLICVALSHFLADPDLYARVQHDDASRTRALEEIFRFESAITGMKRLVTRDTQLGGMPLQAGDEVFLAYAAGSRDPSRFTHPERIDVERTGESPHLGFGQGVHACLGAPLARLLLRIELGVLHERLPDLRVAVPAQELRHTVVSEGRGLVSLPLAWTPTTPPARTSRSSTDTATPESVPVIVSGRRDVVRGVVELTLTAVAGDLPAWRPGAHIDLELPGGMVRQYSLTGDASDGAYRVAVLREDAGRGGSRAVHDGVAVGDRLRIRGPRNHFAPQPAPFSLFLAGGIGITPLLPMAAEAEAAGLPWRLLYLGRSRETMAYADDLQNRYGANVYLWPSAERGRYDIDDVWRRLPAGGRVYACGPEELLLALEESARRAGRSDSVVVERFAPRALSPLPDRPFDVELRRSGITVNVAAGESTLDAVNRAGANVLSTCREGTCGTCEVRVLAGIPEHRDSVLGLEDRLAGDTMMTCVSRCVGEKLVLDL